jgi:hypothetical protein
MIMQLIDIADGAPNLAYRARVIDTNQKTGPVLKAVLEWEGLRRAPFGLSSRPRE